jgi:hypothetical protein
VLSTTQCYVASGDILKEKRFLYLFLAKKKYNVEAIVKIYEPFVYGEI